MATLLAIDTATEVMSLALVTPQRTFVHDGEGGAKASAQLIARALQLAGEAGVTLRQLDAFAFGIGPGAFTGLRTACAVAQGFAFAAHRPVLAIDSLLLVADDARAQLAPTADAPFDIWVAMDARMDEVYAAAYRWADGRWQVRHAPALYTLEALAEHAARQAPMVVAGSAVDAFGARLPLHATQRVAREASRAQALARLALAAWQRGERLAPERAHPLYLRDKVALTSAERLARSTAGGVAS
jgi:tRNA threonylcarbamoyladenosine biosynthesis protein TsaB